MPKAQKKKFLKTMSSLPCKKMKEAQKTVSAQKGKIMKEIQELEKVRFGKYIPGRYFDKSNSLTKLLVILKLKEERS